MGTQTAIAQQIKEQKSDYVLALKGNHSNLKDDVSYYFTDEEFLTNIKIKGITNKRQKKLVVE